MVWWVCQSRLWKMFCKMKFDKLSVLQRHLKHSEDIWGGAYFSYSWSSPAWNSSDISFIKHFTTVLTTGSELLFCRAPGWNYDVWIQAKTELCFSFSLLLKRTLIRGAKYVYIAEITTTYSQIKYVKFHKSFTQMYNPFWVFNNLSRLPYRSTSRNGIGIVGPTASKHNSIAKNISIFANTASKQLLALRCF